MIIDNHGQVENGSLLTQKSDYKPRVLFTRKSNRVRNLTYDLLDYSPSRQESKLWQARGNFKQLLTLPKNNDSCN